MLLMLPSAVAGISMAPRHRAVVSTPPSQLLQATNNYRFRCSLSVYLIMVAVTKCAANVVQWWRICELSVARADVGLCVLAMRASNDTETK